MPSLINHLLHLTNFQSPLLQTLVPCTAAAYALQAAVAVPSVAVRSERVYDFSGAATYLAVAALSLWLPGARAAQKVGGAVFGGGLSSMAAGNWRRVVLAGAVSVWATRLGSYLFRRVIAEGGDSRFTEIKKNRRRFFVAFMVQATWVSICMLPVIAVNAIPASAFAVLGSRMRPTDLLGLGLFTGGLALEAVADWQKSKWLQEKRGKEHDEIVLTRGVWQWSRHPNYLGEMTLWTGIATTAAGTLLFKPVGAAMGLGRIGVLTLCFASPAFVAFILMKVSGIPLIGKKYDAKYGHRKDYQEWKRNTPRLFPKFF